MTYEDGYLSMDEFMDTGVDLIVDDSRQSEEEQNTNAVYLVQAKIVDPDTLDEDGNATVVYDFGAKNQCESSGNTHVLSFNSQKFADWSGSFAGMNLVVKIRKTAADAISSVWSEEMTYQLPGARLESVKMEEATVSLDSGYETIEQNNQKGSKEINGLTMKAITLEPVSYADAYQIKLVENTKDQKVHEFWLRKADDKWQISDADADLYDEKDQYIQWTDLVKTESEENDITTDTYTMDALYTCPLVYTTEGAVYTYEAQTALTIVERRGDTTITLQLPDTENYHGMAYRSTSEVQIRPIMLKETQNEDKKNITVITEETKHYQSGKWMHWLRDEKGSGITIEEMKEDKEEEKDED
jgi:hypothetical protein